MTAFVAYYRVSTDKQGRSASPTAPTATAPLRFQT